MQEIKSISEELDCLNIQLKELIPEYEKIKNDKMVQMETEYALKEEFTDKPQYRGKSNYQYYHSNESYSTPKKEIGRLEKDDYYLRTPYSGNDNVTMPSPGSGEKYGGNNGEYLLSSVYSKQKRYENYGSLSEPRPGANEYYRENVYDLNF